MTRPSETEHIGPVKSHLFQSKQLWFERTGWPYYRPAIRPPSRQSSLFPRGLEGCDSAEDCTVNFLKVVLLAARELSAGVWLLKGAACFYMHASLQAKKVPGGVFQVVWA